MIVLNNFIHVKYIIRIIMLMSFDAGGTPYADVRTTDELMLRVVKGARLAQVETIEDELYRLMLTCWEADTQERPTFHNLQAQLRAMAQQRHLVRIFFHRVFQNKS